MAKFKGMNCLWYLVRSWCLGLSSWPVILSGLAGMTPWTTWESLVCSVRRWNHPVGWIRTSYLDFALRRWMWPWPHSRVPLSPFWNMNLFRVSVIRRSFGLGDSLLKRQSPFFKHPKTLKCWWGSRSDLTQAKGAQDWGRRVRGQMESGSVCVNI